MTKKHFIALADTIKDYNKRQGIPFLDRHREALADFCERQNPHFDRDGWLGYIAGSNGPNGGKVKP